MKIHNFSAGPGVLPRPVLEQAQTEFLDFKESGSCLMELSHRGKEFESVIKQAESDLRTLLDIPAGYKVLFMQGGATLQFAAVVYNLLDHADKPVDYIVTGAWSEKAMKEAKKLGAKVNVVVNTSTSNHNGELPPSHEWKFSDSASYIYYCSNETIHGVEFQTDPPFENPRSIPVVCDMSSNILTKPIDVSKYGLIFAGAQKNIGPAGVTVVIIREDLIKKEKIMTTPTMLDYEIFASSDSMYNTPPTYPIYISGLVFKWILDVGGLQKMTELSDRKSGLIYESIKSSDGFYYNPVNSQYQSRVNIPFRIMKNGQPDIALEKKFLAEAESLGLVQLKGHRSVGGIRPSLYNALPLESVNALVGFMNEFARRNR